MNIEHREVGQGTILLDGGEPVQVGLVMRQSTTSPTRIKAILAATVEDDEGNMGLVPMPFAQAVMAAPDRMPSGFTPEFRLEMN